MAEVSVEEKRSANILLYCTTPRKLRKKFPTPPTLTFHLFPIIFPSSYDVVFSFFIFFEVLWIVEVDHYRVFLDIAFFENFLNNFILWKRAMLFDNLSDHILDNATQIAPFRQCVETSPNKNKPRIFNKLVVRRSNMRFFVE